MLRRTWLNWTGKNTATVVVGRAREVRGRGVVDAEDEQAAREVVAVCSKPSLLLQARTTALVASGTRTHEG